MLGFFERPDGKLTNDQEVQGKAFEQSLEGHSIFFTGDDCLVAHFYCPLSYNSKMEEKYEESNSACTDAIIYTQNNCVSERKHKLFEHIWNNSTCGSSDVDRILDYFNKRSIPIDKDFIRSYDIRFNTYKGNESIVIPIHNTSGEMVQIHQIFINQQNEKQGKIFQGSFEGDCCFQFGNGSDALIFEGFEDALSWYYCDDEDASSYTFFVCFSWTGFNHLSGFLKGYKNKTLILDNDGTSNLAAIKGSENLAKDGVIRLMHPKEKYDCNSAVQDGAFIQWKDVLVEYQKTEPSAIESPVVTDLPSDNPYYSFYRDKIQPRLTLEIAFPDVRFDSYVLNDSGYFETTCPFAGCSPNKFHVHSSNFIYKCFKCGESGNAIDYIRDSKKLTFKQTIEYFAKALGIQIPVGQGIQKKEISETEKLIDELNTKHAVIGLGNKFAVLHRTKHPTKSWDEIKFLPTKEFMTLYQNRFISVEKETEKGKKTKRINHSTFFLEHSKRRYYDGICFIPKKDFVSETLYNLFQGFAVDESKLKDATPEGCILFLRHILHVLASDDQKLFKYILNWCADAIQHPEKRTGVALVMRSGEGTGKGTFVELVGEIFGPHYLHVTNSEHLVGKFNAHMASNLLLFADEARWAGDKKSEGILKGLITEKSHMIERKGFDSVQVANYSRIIFASNQDWVVPAGKSDRRYMVFDVSDSKANDRQYFKAIRDEWNNGGKECFFKFLMDQNIEDYDFVNDRPLTSAMRQQKERTMGQLENWYHEVLDEGRFNDTENYKDFDLSKNTKNEVNSDLVHQSYLSFCIQVGGKRKVSKNELSRFFKNNVKGFKSTRKGKSKTTFWIFPPLNELRRNFDESYNWESDWDSVSDDQDESNKELYNEQTNSEGQCETELDCQLVSEDGD